MAPSALRQTFLWCVPTVAILLSFLWFKRKRSALRSDPGGTNRNSEMGDIKEVKVSEKSSACSAVDEASVKDNCEVLSANYEHAISELHDNVSNEVKKDPIAVCDPVSSEIVLPLEGCGIKSEIDSGDVTTHTNIPNSVNKSGQEDISVAGSLEEKLNVSSSEFMKERVKNSGTLTEEVLGVATSVPENLNLESDISLEESQEVLCDMIYEKSAEMNKNSDSENSNNSIEMLAPHEEMMECISIKIGQLEMRGDFPSNNEQNSSENMLTMESSELSLEESVSKGLDADKDAAPVKNSPASATLCGTVSDINVITGVVSEDSSSSAVLDKIREVECASAVSNVSQSTVTRTEVEAAGELAQKELRESQGECSGSNNDSPMPAGAERDSANHSPADVMLASPSMSNYSDVHSEGSSDSGKGCSYVATPPSRTPASCSSLSGDLSTHSVYEFVLPQQLVGRLIGRHGCFVHQIKAKTNANILIKRHPDTAKLKICAVEGTQMDIENALEMVRQKFPASRYPNVSLEQVCFLPPASTVALIPEFLQLQLVEGVNNDVILSSLVTPAHFFLQQPTHPTFPALNQLSACMNMSYSEPGAPQLPSTDVGIICAAPTMGGWYRAQIVSADVDTNSCVVKFIDYGGYLTLPSSELKQIRSDFMTLPFQAAECYLAHVVPAGGLSAGWSAAARTYVENLIRGQVLQAQVCGYAEDGIPVVYLFSAQGTHVVPIHMELVAQGLAEWWEPSES